MNTYNVSGELWKCVECEVQHNNEDEAQEILIDKLLKDFSQNNWEYEHLDVELKEGDKE